MVRHSVLALLVAMALWSSAAAQTTPQLRLADPLDFPGEGYCIDIVGVGTGARTDLPLVAHNCLPERNATDRMVVEQDGRLVFPTYEACVTAFGVSAPLPGSAVILRPCGGGDAFLPHDRLQRFERSPENRLQLIGTPL